MTARSRLGRPVLLLAGGLALAAAGTALAAPSQSQQKIVDAYAALAKTADTAFAGVSAERGKAFFHARHTGGKPDMATCTSCHSEDLKKPGRTRAGKEIAPMAASVNGKRYADPAEVEKWFKRNCADVLGRECTAAEKGDVLAYLLAI